MELTAARNALAASPETRARLTSLDATITMDEAQLAMMQGEHASAIALYDRVAADANARARDRRIAAQNAAMLCQRLGRYREAVQRVDSLLASPLATDMPDGQRIMVRVSQANWPAEGGDLSEALRLSMAVWRDYHDRDDSAVLQLGLRIARWTPGDAEHCADRIELTRLVLDKILALRARGAAPPNDPYAASPAELDTFENDALVILANTFGRPDDASVMTARERLGLPIEQ